MSVREEAQGDGIGRADRETTRHRPLEVSVGDRGVEAALRIFKRLVLRDGILRDLKRRAHYEKPGDRRRRKQRESVRRLRKQRVRAMARGERLD
jgi:small subunit ribosomal protein S21